MKPLDLKIIKKYKRKSKSKWSDLDDSCILMLAKVKDASNCSLCFERTIYLHRDSVGRWLGVSISNQLQNELNDGIGKFHDGTDMLNVLLRYSDEMLQFWRSLPRQVHDDFESVFGIDPLSWFESCKLRWKLKSKNT